MTTTLYATYDGEALRLEEPLSLEPGTRVRITLDAVPPKKMGKPYSSLHAALAARIDGPPDWSERIHEYLYGEGCRSDG
jgi:hypothetical protein